VNTLLRNILENLSIRNRISDKDIPLDWETLYGKIIDRLKEYKYIDDEAFARMFVNSRLTNKPRGKSVLIGELLSKGIDKELAIQVCNELVEDELDILDKAFKKRYKEEKLDLKNTKMVSFLMRKGFNWDLIERYSKDES
jgi:regulatory protein